MGEKDDRLKGVLSAFATFYFQKDLTKASSRHNPRNVLVLGLGYKRGKTRNSESRVFEEWNLDY